MKLLSRDEFRNAVFERDKHLCVICGKPVQDAHHIIERRLFADGGYYIDNGSSLCHTHHIQAEETLIECSELRLKCGIETTVLPEHLYDDYEYDKWGNIILLSGQRLKGELFHDESVQKILKQGGVLNLFQKYVKYPRTYHLHWSKRGKDDRQLANDDNFKGKRVIGTLKMDGENTSMYSDYIHARSLDSNSHPTRDWVKGLWSRISYLLDDNMRVCGENLYALHSVEYKDLPSYFMAFSIWMDNLCLSWDETTDYCKVLGLEVVPVIYDGIYNKEAIIKSFAPYEKSHEGYTIRLADSFTYADFRRSVAKYVRPEFRQVLNNSHGHWISQKIKTNSIK